jgi:hypothetical protein
MVILKRRKSSVSAQAGGNQATSNRPTQAGSGVARTAASRTSINSSSHIQNPLYLPGSSPDQHMIDRDRGYLDVAEEL